MIRLSIPTRNPAGVKHPRAKPAASGGSPTVACLYCAIAILLVIAFGDTWSSPGGQWWALGLFAALQFVLMFLAVPATSFGASAVSRISFDRLPLVASLLLFDPLAAACAAGASALAFGLAANPERLSPWRRTMRALGIGGMYFLATLAAGHVWMALGGNVPIGHFGLINIDRIALMIITLQGVNEVLYAVFNWQRMDAASRRRPIHWPTALLEFAIAWTGVAAARAFLNLTLGGFALYLLLVLIIAALLKYSVHVVTRERRRARELAAVNRVNQAVDAAASLDELLETIFREARGLMDFAAFVIGAYDAEADEIDLRFNYDNGTRHPPRRRKPEKGVIGWTLAQGESVFIADTRTSNHPSLKRRVVTGAPAIAIMAVPIVFRGETIGAMSAQNYRPNSFRRHDLRLLEGFARQVAVAIVNTNLFEDLQRNRKELENRVARRTVALERTSASLRRAMEQKEVLLERLERENRRDSLTGLANRRHLDEILRQEHYRARRFEHPLALAIGDLDRFKEVNDRWGHETGDQVLQTVATVLGGELRATDLLARYGGEEFVIIFPETTGEAAFAVCEKLRSRIAEYDWATMAADFALTISLGVAANRGGEKSRAQLLADADRALYRAKRDGRNCVRLENAENRSLRLL